MDRDRSPRRRSVALAFAIVWLSPGLALAHEGAPPAKPAEPEPPPIVAIPLEDIPERAEATIAELESLAPEEKSREVIDETTKYLKEEREKIRERLEGVRVALETKPKVRTLDELEKQLLALVQPLTGLDKELDQHVTALGAALDTVDPKAEVWAKTAEAARKASASRAALDRIAATRAEIKRTRNELIGRRNEILTLRDELVDPKSSVEDLLASVRAARQERLESVFSSSRSALFSAAVRESLERELREGLGGAVSHRWAELREYAVKERKLLGFQLVLFLGLAVGLRVLRARVRLEREHHADLSEAAQVFELPTAMALVISLATTPELHPFAPTLFMRLLGALAVLPAVLIVRRLVPAAMTPLLWGLVVFFLADRVRDLVATLPTLERVILQAEMVGALVFLFWLRRPSRLARVPEEMLQDPTFRRAGVAIRIAMVILVVASVADVIGLGDLADLLGTSTLRSAYAGLFIYAFTAVLQSLAAYMLLVRPLRLMRGISRQRQLIRGRVDRVLRIAGLLAWLYVVLSFFGMAEVAMSLAARLLGAGLSVGALSISLGDVAVFGLTVWLTFVLARLVNFVLEEDVFPRVHLARGVPYAISSLVRYSLIVLGLLAALAATGIELSKLTVIAGGLGVGIGFGLQNVVNNFVSGLILLFERPLKVGDSVQLPNLWGEITRIGIRASVVRTFDGAEVIVPNGLLISDPVTNWTLSDQRRRIEVTVGVEYGTDAQRVIDLLLGVARAHERILDEPEPQAYFVSFGESSLDFLLRVWLPSFEGGYQVRSDLAVAIQAALKQSGIGVPFPQRDLHVKSLNPEIAAELSPRRPGGDPI